MIVDPDFPDHWKTRLLVDALDGDESAPVYLLRLWAHCQNRRVAIFPNLPAAALRALCRYPGAAEKLESALTTAGFTRREGDSLEVCSWEEYNAGLVANWSNGKKGGRPPKARQTPGQQQQQQAPAIPVSPGTPPLETTHGLAMDNPPETHGEPTANPSITVKRREDRRGEDKTGKKEREKEREDRSSVPHSPVVPETEAHANTDASPGTRGGSSPGPRSSGHDAPSAGHVISPPGRLSNGHGDPGTSRQDTTATMEPFAPERNEFRAPAREGACQSAASAGRRRPTLDQAKAAATGMGILTDKADEWWHAREASGWLKGMAGGGTAPVGANWQADLKIYATRGMGLHPSSGIGRHQTPATGRAGSGIVRLPWEIPESEGGQSEGPFVRSLPWD